MGHRLNSQRLDRQLGAATTMSYRVVEVGFDTYESTNSQNITMDFLTGGQDPSFNDLFLMDTSAFDFLFSEDIS
jgi:hypothetical protein